MGGAGSGIADGLQYCSKDRAPSAAGHRSSGACGETGRGKRRRRDEAAAEVLSIRYFTFLQLVLAALLYSPGLVAIWSCFLC
jgi:hypothetical protein